MREHRSADAVTDRIHSFDPRATFLIDHNKAALVKLDAGVFCKQSVRQPDVDRRQR